MRKSPKYQVNITQLLKRYSRCKLFDVAAVCFICTSPSVSQPPFLMVPSSQLSIPKGQLPISSLFTLLGKGLATTLMETERKILCVGDCMDAKLVLVKVSNSYEKKKLSVSCRSICPYLSRNSTEKAQE